VHVSTGQYCGWCVCAPDQISKVKFQLIFSSNYPHHSSLFSLSFCLSLSFCFSLPHLSLLFLPHYSLLDIIFFKLFLKYFNFPTFRPNTFSTILCHRSLANDSYNFIFSNSSFPNFIPHDYTFNFSFFFISSTFSQHFKYSVLGYLSVLKYDLLFFDDKIECCFVGIGLPSKGSTAMRTNSVANPYSRSLKPFLLKSPTVRRPFLRQDTGSAEKPMKSDDVMSSSNTCKLSTATSGFVISYVKTYGRKNVDNEVKM
jgi:hypothetical protein